MERIPKTKFVCIEYPGVVQNEEKMLDTLGGEERVSKLYSDNTKRLELRWRPKDQYCRPAYADRHSTTNLLMHVRRRWRRKKTGPSHDTNPEIEEEIEAKMLGTVETTYRFKGQADMQYLPMCKKEDGTYESITESTYLDKPQPKSYLNKEVPLFLPPHLFSRIDQSMDYMYRKDQGDNVDTEITKDVIGLGRKRRAVCTFLRKFSDESDFIPPHRQMFFQASDILIPEVNKLLHENDGKESECTERDGWGVLNFADECRKHMLTYVYEAWKKQGLQLGDASTAADDSTMDVNDDDQTFANEEDDDANVEDMETDWNEMLDYT